MAIETEINLVTRNIVTEFYVLVTNTAKSKESGLELVCELIQGWSLQKITPH